MELKGFTKEEDTTWQKFETWIGEQVNNLIPKEVKKDANDNIQR